MKRLVLIAVALAATTATVSAHDSYRYDRGDRVDAREARQAGRIANSRLRGELTWFEAMKLRREQAHIHRMERRAERDGHIDRYEARRIEHAQDRASRHINNQSHDDQKAAWWRRW